MISDDFLFVLVVMFTDELSINCGNKCGIISAALVRLFRFWGDQ